MCSSRVFILCAVVGVSRYFVGSAKKVVRVFAEGGNDSGDKRLPVNLVYPGTKWCGNGNIAEDYEDLGQFAETDACCRGHDHCQDVIPATETKHNLTNYSFYTRSHCTCDEKFYDCLHRSGDEAGSKIGVIYFSVVNNKCFRDDYPIIACKRHSSFPRRCLEYELDDNGKKFYQWFDLPPY